MSENITKLIIILVAILVEIYAIRRGYKRGIAAEIRAVISVAVAALCLVLIIILKNAVQERTFGTVIVIAGALMILGSGWKIVRTILGPLSGFKELRAVRAIDALLGGIAGAAEGVLLIWVMIKICSLINLIT